MVPVKRVLCLFSWALIAQTALARQPDFTDRDLERTLRQESRVLFYSFSSGMPLSLTGLNEIRHPATDLHAHVIFLLDPLTTEAELRSLSLPADILPLIKYQKSRRLRDLGIQLHYPSLIVSGDHRVVGPPIPGFKSRAGYVTLVSDLLKLSWQEIFRVSRTVELPRPTVSPFSKPLYGTDFVILGWAFPSYLFNIKTAQLHDIGVNTGGDAGATPDGEFITFISGAG